MFAFFNGGHVDCVGHDRHQSAAKTQIHAASKMGWDARRSDTARQRCCNFVTLPSSTLSSSFPKSLQLLSSLAHIRNGHWLSMRKHCKVCPSYRIRPILGHLNRAAVKEALIQIYWCLHISPHGFLLHQANCRHTSSTQELNGHALPMQLCLDFSVRRLLGLGFVLQCL